VICTASTVKDSPGNVALFVERNLAAGVDHMFVFLDDVQPEVEELLASNPFVTAVAAYGPYWGGWRPPGLNTRQTINANLVRVLLAPLGWARWLFHIDGDESLDIDKDHLLSLDPAIGSVQLQVLEGVSTRDGSARHLFKRRLDPPELALLRLLGVIERADNTSLFNGYVVGKAGIRPSLDRQLHIHKAKDLDAQELESYEHPCLRVLHFDSVSLEEFRRKWGAHHGAQLAAKYGQKKDEIRSAVTSVVDNGHLDEVQKDRYVARLYERTMQDDVETLDELGFLERPTADRHSHTPARLSDEQHHQIQVLLPMLVASHKDHYRLRTNKMDPAVLLLKHGHDLRRSEPDLAIALTRCAAATGRAR
jgi:Glycosyl transferase family 2